MMNEDIRNAFQARDPPVANPHAPLLPGCPRYSPCSCRPSTFVQHAPCALQMANPFVFKYVQQLKQDRVDDSGPCVLMATPSMLQVSSLFPSHLPSVHQPIQRGLKRAGPVNERWPLPDDAKAQLYCSAL